MQAESQERAVLSRHAKYDTWVMQKLGKSKKEGSRLHRDWETEGLRSQTTDLGVCPEGSGQSRKSKGVVGGGKVTLALSYPIICHQQPISLLCLAAYLSLKPAKDIPNLRVFALAFLFAWRGRSEDLLE